MVNVAPSVLQRDVWWADLRQPVGSLSGYKRPVVVIQGDDLNVSRLKSYLCVPLTSNLKAGRIPWNPFLRAAVTGLPEDSIAQTNLALAVDTSQMIEHVGRIGERQLQQIFTCLDLVLGRA